ncbi:PCNA-interacting partner [Galendromus occidentalis]|uniref:PCNA-interacting partner n=1 Tax=Galendromus occidentalis TaxID=34638 RepID=A0AAJ7L5Y5_9ACAR|nr:PCNA-interacting partner [Galendromus occidentalis]
MEVLLFEESTAPHAESVRQRLPAGYTVLCTEAFDDVSTPTIFSFLVNLARKHSLLGSWQSTVLSHKEFFESLKVVSSRLNLESYGEFNVTTSSVINSHKAYFAGEDDSNAAAYRNFLKECNAVDQFALLKLLKNNRGLLEDDLGKSFRVEGTIRSEWQVSAISFLAGKKSLRRVQTELPMDGAVTEILSSQIKYEDIEGCHRKDVKCPKQSQSLEYTLTILKSFLNLLVNTRDEVSIACALACPLVNLTHEGFTVVKRSASREKSPIYQFVLSYVMRKRLGGAGYAAPEDCPISAYSKELSNFVDVMDKLQTLIEDNPKVTVAINKITNSVLNKLSKTIAGNSIKISMIDKARGIVGSLLERIRGQNNPTDPTINPGIVGRDTIAVVRSLADELATLGYHQSVSKILCSPFSAATPSRTPVGSQTLFKLFQSPVESRDDDDDDELRALTDRVPLAPTPPSKPVLPFSVKFEPEAPRLHLFDENERIDSSFDAAEARSTPTRRPIRGLSSRSTNQDTPVIKNLTKRREANAEEKTSKKRLKLGASALDPENVPAASKAASNRGKVKPKKKKIEPSSNQRSLHSFFSRV